ncbi:MAG TPA: glycosyltransferase [Spirochaetia bacterium]|nr:glycosyltransferase [Spirochaetia bacterium]
MKLAVFAIGSQGDVRPSAALGAGLVAAGHQVRLATLPAFKGLAEEYGMEFAPINIDPYEFITGDIGQSWMRSMDKPGKLAAGFIRAAREMVEELNSDAVRACRGAEALLYNVPLSISGHTVAEALKIPGIPNSVAPYHPTGDFPTLFVPKFPTRSAVANRISGRVAFQVFWMSIRSEMNRWRRSQGGMSALQVRNPLGRMTRDGVPWLYGFSPSVIPAPADWPATARVCGYWFTRPQQGWQPPRGLEEFLAASPRPIYVGFGSMVGSDPEHTMATVREGLRLAGARSVVASGWGGMKSAAVSDQVYALESIPHEWLFPRVAAAVHHGGAGTTAAALRAGVPSIVVPYFYDQFFWGRRLQRLGAAPALIAQRHFTPRLLADAIRAVTSTAAYAKNAQELSRQIAGEDGVREAVKAVEQYLGAISGR